MKQFLSNIQEILHFLVGGIEAMHFFELQEAVGGIFWLIVFFTIQSDGPHIQGRLGSQLVPPFESHDLGWPPNFHDKRRAEWLDPSPFSTGVFVHSYSPPLGGTVWHYPNFSLVHKKAVVVTLLLSAIPKKYGRNEGRFEFG